MELVEEINTVNGNVCLHVHVDQEGDCCAPLQQDDEEEEEIMNDDHDDEGGMCDLCNEKGMQGGREAHIAEYHGTALCWLSNVLSKERNEVLCAKIPEDCVSTLGAFIFKSVSGLDKGPHAFQVIQRAAEQMNYIMSDFMKDTRTYLFGSCVSTGSWDGIGDADFTVIREKRLEAGDWPPKDESKYPAVFARALRSCGFLFEELEVIPRTRVPLAKREQKTRPPTHCYENIEDFRIVYTFFRKTSEDDRDKLSKALRKLGTDINVIKLDNLRLMAHFPSAIQALGSLCQHFEYNQYSKEWHKDSPLPEIFSVDFDVSCRPFGVRNSWYLRQYLSQSPEARAGNAFLKQWSKKCGINNSSRGYLTSYAVTILWVHYLLRTKVVSYVDPSSVLLVPTERQREVSYIPLLGTDATQSGNDGVGAVNVALADSLGRLIVGFFRYYNDFSWDEFVVSLRTPEGCVRCEDLGWTQKNEVMSTIIRERIWYRICVEDPYEDNLNLGRHLSPEKARFVRAQFVCALSAVLQQRPARLLIDRKAAAENKLRVNLFRALVECGVDRMNATDAREAVRQWADEETLGTYEIWRKSLVSLVEDSVNMEFVPKSHDFVLRNMSESVNKRRRNRGANKKAGMEKEKEAKPSDVEVKESEETESKHNEGDESMKYIVDDGIKNDKEELQMTEQKQNKSKKVYPGEDSSKEDTNPPDEMEPHRNVMEKNVKENENENEKEEESEKEEEREKEKKEKKKRELQALHSALVDTDEKVKAAGETGLPVKEVPALLRDAYHVAFQRAFFTLEDMSAFRQYAEVIGKVLSTGQKTRDDVRAVVQKKIPEITCIDVLLDILLVEDGDFVRLAVMTQAKHVQPRNPVRKRVNNKLNPPPPKNGVSRSKKDPIMSKCDECFMPAMVWAASDPNMDPGVYCVVCWRNFSR